MEQVRSLERELAEGAAVAAERQLAERSVQQLQERLEQQQAAVQRERDRSARLETQTDELRKELAEARKQTAAHEAVREATLLVGLWEVQGIGRRCGYR